MKATSYTATIEDKGRGKGRIRLVLMEDSGRYCWHERDGNADCEVSGSTIREAARAAEKAWADWDFQLNRTKPS